MKKIRLSLSVLTASFSLLGAHADDGLSDHSIAPLAAPVPVTSPVPGPMPEDKQLPSRRAAAKADQWPVATALHPEAREMKRQLDAIEMRLKTADLSDRDRFDLKLQRDQLKKKLEAYH